MDLDLLFVLGLFALLTTVVVVVIWQVSATWRARAALAREQEYRRLAQDTERHLGTISTELTGLGDRVTALERMLREVQ